MLSLSALSIEAKAGAAPSQQDRIKQVCKEVSSKKLDDACNDKQLIQSVQKAANSACENESTRAKALDCADKEAKEYFTKAKKKESSSVAKYKTAVNEVAKDASAKARSSQNPPGGDPAAQPCDSNKCDFIKKYVNPAIALLTASFGIIAAMSIIIGGIQYSSSGGDPQKVAKAKQRITNTVIAIVAYFFLAAFLQFLVPGGIFNR